MAEPGTCIVCDRPDREAIEADLRIIAPYLLTEKYGVCSATLRSHRGHMRPLIDKPDVLPEDPRKLCHHFRARRYAKACPLHPQYPILVYRAYEPTPRECLLPQNVRFAIGQLYTSMLMFAGLIRSEFRPISEQFAHTNDHSASQADRRYAVVCGLGETNAQESPQPDLPYIDPAADQYSED